MEWIAYGLLIVTFVVFAVVISDISKRVKVLREKLEFETRMQDVISARFKEQETLIRQAREHCDYTLTIHAQALESLASAAGLNVSYHSPKRETHGHYEFKLQVKR